MKNNLCIMFTAVTMIALMLFSTITLSVGASNSATLEELFEEPLGLPTAKPETETEADTGFESLRGLTVNVIGDSYLRGQTLALEQTWTGLLAEKYDWNITNYAKNGGMVSTYAPSVDPDPMVNRYEDMADNDADIIIFNGGKNDFNQSVRLGKKNGDDTDTYMGALNVLIDGLQKKYPNAVLIYTSVWNFPGTNSLGYTYRSYATAAFNVCHEQGVYMFHAYEPTVSGVDMQNEAFKTQYCLSPTDVSHLNVDGMKLVMPKFEKFIAESLEDAQKNGKTQTDTAESTAVTQPAEDTKETDTSTLTEPVEEGGCNSAVAMPITAVTALLTSALLLTVRRRKKKEYER